jgi:3-deoxy-manno-octulosonate cytidylyltransferase (CMP-KDO synthetase)
VFAALEKFDIKNAHDVIVNLQGDLPLLDPAQLQIVVEALAASAADIATLAAPVVDEADVDNPNVVKPVIAWNADGSLGRALNFTRARAPYGPGAVFHHIGIYAFRRVALARFVALAPSPLEQREKLEQLRALEAGMSIAVARVDKVPLSVDTEADLARVREAVARDAESSSHGSTSSA